MPHLCSITYFPRSITQPTMNNYDIYTDQFADDALPLPHLPLDWNEDLSLEEYLERMERKARAVRKSNEE